MALRTGNRCMHPGQRIVRIGRMIELGIVPGCCRMADGAIVWQAKLHVRRIGGLLEVDGVSMATVAVHRSSSESVVDVA